MSNAVYEINGKKYTKEEIVGICKFWRLQSDTEKIDDYLNFVVENDANQDISSFIKANYEMVRGTCIDMLPSWQGWQDNAIEAKEVSISDLVLKLLYSLCYNKRDSSPN